MLTPTPFQGAASNMHFYVPPTVQTDFENYLDTDVPNVNFTWEIVHSWPDRSEPGYEPTYCRAEMFPINWKSNLANADNTSNFKTDLRVPIQKGDIAIREDGNIRQLNWKVEKKINEQSTQGQECNLMLTVKRMGEETVDPDTGILTKEAEEVTVVSEHPCAIYQYDGRPEYAVGPNTPGAVPDVLSIIQIQWNSATQDLRIGDEFEWVADTHRIINLDYSGIDISGDNGILRIHTRKVAGAQGV